jgi:hypothetical protein
MSRARSGRYAAVYASYQSTPVQSAWLPTTWTTASKYVSVGSNFWLHSYDHQVEVRVNGCVSGFNVTAGATNTVQIAAGTLYTAGSLTTVAADSVAALAAATASGSRIVHALIYSTSGGLQKISGVSGAASTTRGTAGGPPFIPVNAVVIAYVTRAYGAAAVITSAEITYTSFDGREWTNAPGVDEIRPLLGRAYFLTVPASVHTGSVPPKVYWRGYSFNNNFIKIGEIKNWSLNVTIASEDATVQNSFAMENDEGRKTYALSYEEFISDAIHSTFAHVVNGNGDRIFKMFPNRNEATKYWACQGRTNVNMTFPLDNKASSSNTVTVTGRVEEFTS